MSIAEILFDRRSALALAEVHPRLMALPVVQAVVVRAVLSVLGVAFLLPAMLNLLPLAVVVMVAVLPVVLAPLT